MTTTRDPTPDERAILAVLADSAMPLSPPEILGALNPRPERRDGRTRVFKAWAARWVDLSDALSDLLLARLAEVAVPADGEHLSQVGITEAGRATLRRTEARDTDDPTAREDP